MLSGASSEGCMLHAERCTEFLPVQNLYFHFQAFHVQLYLTFHFFSSIGPALSVFLLNQQSVSMKH